MAAQQAPQFTEADAQSLADKLGQLSETLPRGEQIALIALIQRAAEAEDSQGYGWWDPIGQQTSTDRAVFRSIVTEKSMMGLMGMLGIGPGSPDRGVVG